MFKILKMLFDFILSLFNHNKQNDFTEEDCGSSCSEILKITDIKIDKYKEDTFHMRIFFPFEQKEKIKSIIVKVKGDKNETGYIQCNHLTYDEPTKIQPLCGLYLPATFELQPQNSCLKLDYEAPYFILVNMISKTLDLEIQLIAKDDVSYFVTNSEIKQIHIEV